MVAAMIHFFAVPVWAIVVAAVLASCVVVLISDLEADRGRHSRDDNGFPPYM
jgi:hypothetical protein